MNLKVFLRSTAVLAIMAIAWSLDSIKPQVVSPGAEDAVTVTNAEPPDAEIGADEYLAFMQASADCYSHQQCFAVRQMVAKLRERNVCVLGTEPARIIPCPVPLEDWQVKAALDEMEDQ